MNKMLFALLCLVGIAAAHGQSPTPAVPPQTNFQDQVDMLDMHVLREGQYWLNGVPNTHQRYSAICGVYRQDDDKRQIAVIYVDRYDPQSKRVAGELVGTKTVVETVTDDMDYIYGALGISRMCAEIPTVLTESTADGLSADGTVSGHWIRSITRTGEQPTPPGQ